MPESFTPSSRGEAACPTGIFASLNGGLGSADDGANVMENRARMARSLGVAPEHLVTVHQVHSPDALVVEGPWPGERPKADGMVTRTPGLALAVLSADCGPVLFADAQARVIGAVPFRLERRVYRSSRGHGGSHGTIGGRSRPHRGGARPHHQRRRLRGRAGIRGAIHERGRRLARFFKPSPREGHAWFDLPDFIGTRLRKAGIGHFTNLGLCTYSDAELFYSYRRTTHRGEPDYGRLVSAITLSGLNARRVLHFSMISGVRQPICWPASTAIIWPVTLRARAR